MFLTCFFSLECFRAATQEARRLKIKTVSLSSSLSNKLKTDIVFLFLTFTCLKPTTADVHSLCYYCSYFGNLCLRQMRGFDVMDLTFCDSMILLAASTRFPVDSCFSYQTKKTVRRFCGRTTGLMLLVASDFTRMLQ